MIKINLLRPTKKEIPLEEAGIPIEEEELKKERYDLFALVSVISLLLMGFLFYRTSSYKSDLADTIAQLKAERDRLSDILKKIQETEEKKRLLLQKTQIIENLISKQVLPVKLMDMVSKALPDAVWLTSLEYSGRTLKIKGNALTNNMIADFIANLEATGLFSEVNLIKSTKSRRYKEAEVYEFQLEAILTATPTEKTSQEEAK